MKKSNLLSIAALSLLLPLSAFAGTSPVGTMGGGVQQGDTGQETSADFTANERAALQVLNMNNINEIRGSLLAFEKVTSQDVRDLAWKVIQSHVASEKNLIAFAKEYKFELVSTEANFVASQNVADTMLDTLKNTPDAEFASLFLMNMKSSHVALLTQLQGWEPSVKQTEIKAFLDQSIADIKAHDKLAAGITLTPTTPGTEQPAQPVQPAQ